jgi:hypothetical protein
MDGSSEMYVPKYLAQFNSKNVMISVLFCLICNLI